MGKVPSASAVRAHVAVLVSLLSLPELDHCSVAGVDRVVGQ